MPELDLSDFTSFFRAIHGREPFPWQSRLAKAVCEDGWPDAIDLPTASGKTACLDIAVFAQLVAPRAPRRIFYVVDRRVVVDAAFARMRKIRDTLSELNCANLPFTGIDVVQLRGGIYRDDSWIRNPLQPTLVATTVDQIGSRLLFRGYGVSDKNWPIHSGLIANDALILLDEAHCSQAFAQTLDAIDKKYRTWATNDLRLPFAFVEMTATPARQARNIFRLNAEDYAHSPLRQRLFASKPVRLLQPSKGRPQDFSKLAADLVTEALRYAHEPGLRRIAVMVNRINTARLVYAALREGGAAVHLIIGRMRPIDRADLPSGLKAMVSGEERTSETGPVFVVATQCLEVGADLDFDALVTECASIDSLLQRFGRLDRIGDLNASGVTSRGSVCISSYLTEPKYENDPIYGPALARTWQWLSSLDGKLDFGICSSEGHTTVRERLKSLPNSAVELRSGTPPAPILLPAHLDTLVQTSPRPALEPDLRLFLHGRQNSSPEVQVIWRADLDPLTPETWAETLALCPPVSAEAMQVPLHAFRAWLTGVSGDTGASDLEGVETIATESEGEPRTPVLVWRGDQSQLVCSPPGEDSNTIGPDRIRPGDTLVLPAQSGGWDELGHVPQDIGPDPPGCFRIDVAEPARHALRRGVVIRLHPSLLERWPDTPQRSALLASAADRGVEKSALIAALRDYSAHIDESNSPEWLTYALGRNLDKLIPQPYPDAGGWILAERRIQTDAGQDESSAGLPVALDTHLADVAKTVKFVAAAVPLDAATQQSMLCAARAHDLGKADRRFQALLFGGDPIAAQFSPFLRAKGEQAQQSPNARQAQWRRSGLPQGFRHELTSLLLAGLDPSTRDDELALHLVASHHGRCRPFAPFVSDPAPPALSIESWQVTPSERIESAAHRLSSGVADRFWRLVRIYGWWGLAYVEALLRLADWKASEEEFEMRTN